MLITCSFRDVDLVGFPKESGIENDFAQTLLDSDYIDAELVVRVSAIGLGYTTVKSLNVEKQVLATSDADLNSNGTKELGIPVKDPLEVVRGVT